MHCTSSMTRTPGSSRPPAVHGPPRPSGWSATVRAIRRVAPRVPRHMQAHPVGEWRINGRLVQPGLASGATDKDAYRPPSSTVPGSRARSAPGHNSPAPLTRAGERGPPGHGPHASAQGIAGLFPFAAHLSDSRPVARAGPTTGHPACPPMPVGRLYLATAGLRQPVHTVRTDTPAASAAILTCTVSTLPA